MMLSFYFILVLSLVSGCFGHSYYNEDRIKMAKQALEYVRTVENKQCSGGTEETLRLDFDHEPWIQYTYPAITTANFLTQILAIEGDLNRFREDIFYSMVRNNVQVDDLIFGSAIALEPKVYQDMTRYCPYAFLKNGTVKGYDIAVNYNYQQNTTEWYYVLSQTDFTNITVTTDRITYNLSDPNGSVILYRQPMVTYPIGHWTYPYYDCGGGYIWMTTYSSPVLSVDSTGEVEFKGVATIDIELTKLDINQCDHNDNEEGMALDVFRGTHNCQPTTICFALNEGFKSGAYECRCEIGYYFPNSSHPTKAYRGSDIDSYFESLNNTYTNRVPRFQCLKCARGCDSCVDSSPCLYPISTAIQVLVVFILSVMIIFCIVTSVFIFIYRTQMVIKTASPIFLQLMCFGATLMCASVFVMYGEVTHLQCTIRNWPYHVGFIIMYGALLLKTWRISVIFKTGGTTKRVNLPDKSLLQRMVPMVVLVVGYLSVWTALDPPHANTVKTGSDLKFFLCEMTWWTYAAFGSEAVLLLFGVYLCFTVRKAPAHFNESKFISWATYNAIILGSFVMMLTQFVATTVGPDGVFALMMVEQQVLVTITMTLIFVPKLWALRKGANLTNQVYSNQQVVTITGRVKPSLAAATSSRFNETSSVIPSVETKNMAVQCNEEDFFLICGPKTNQSRTVRAVNALFTRSKDEGINSLPGTRLSSENPVAFLENTLKVPSITRHGSNKVHPLVVGNNSHSDDTSVNHTHAHENNTEA